MYVCPDETTKIEQLTTNGRPLNPVEQFIYLDSNISSTESDVNTRIGKAWSATNK